MRKFKGTAVIFCLLFVFSISLACGGKVELENWSDETIEVVCGETVTLNLSAASDKDGNSYRVSAVVYAAVDTVIDVVGGSFVADNLEGYKIVYSVAVSDKQTFSRTVTVIVTDGDAPTITFGTANKTGKVGSLFTLPSVEVNDLSGETITPQLSLKDPAGATVDISGGVADFTPLNWGKYIYTATATDAAGNFDTVTYEIFIRKPAEAGEYESFDDEGILYDVAIESAAVSEKKWHDKWNGRSGVLEFDLKNPQNYVGMFQIFPKENKEFYTEKELFAVSMYIHSPNGKSLASFNWTKNDYNSGKSFKNIQLNSWYDYVIPAQDLISNFTKLQQSGNPSMGAIYGDNVKIYFDRACFVQNRTAATSTLLSDYAVGTKLDLASTITQGTSKLSYSVIFNGKEIDVTDRYFTPSWQGEYTVRPSAVSPINTLTDGEEFVFSATGNDSASFNSYTENITQSTQNIVLPTVAVTDGSSDVSGEYSIKTEIIFISLSGKVEQGAKFDKMRRGVYKFNFAGVKGNTDGFNITAEVSVNAPSQNEVFDADASGSVNLMGAMFGGEKNKIEAKDVPNGYADGKGVVAFTDKSGLVNYADYNFAPAREPQYYLEKFSFVTFNLYVTTSDTATTQVSAKFFATDEKILTVNEWHTVKLDISGLLRLHNASKLYENANWSDYAIEIKPVNGTFVGKQKTVYFGDITAGKEEFSKNLVKVDENAASKFVSSSSTQKAYVGAAELAQKGFGGNYVGGAIKFPLHSSHFKFAFPYSYLQNLDEELYSSVSVWILAERLSNLPPDADGGAMTAFMQGYGIIGNYFNTVDRPWVLVGGAAYALRTWHELIIPLSVLKAEVNQDGLVELGYTWINQLDASVDSLYIGDITLLEKESFSPELITVDHRNYSLFSSGSGLAPQYSAANSMSFGGAYMGNAAKIPLKNTSFNFRVPYEYKDSFADYDYLSFWYCIDSNDVSSRVHFMKGTGNGLVGAFSSDWITLPSSGDNRYGEWIKIQVPVSVLTEQITTSGTVKMFSIWFSGISGDDDFIYLGDIKLEKAQI